MAEITRITPCIDAVLCVRKYFALFYPDLIRAPWDELARYRYNRFIMNTAEVHAPDFAFSDLVHLPDATVSERQTLTNSPWLYREVS